MRNIQARLNDYKRQKERLHLLTTSTLPSSLLSSFWMPVLSGAAVRSSFSFSFFSSLSSLFCTNLTSYSHFMCLSRHVRSPTDYHSRCIKVIANHQLTESSVWISLLPRFQTTTHRDCTSYKLSVLGCSRCHRFRPTGAFVTTWYVACIRYSRPRNPN